jgi:aspartate aminotransferase
MGAIYLSVQFNVIGKRTPEGEALLTNEHIRQYLLRSAGVALVPFQAFGSKENSGWFRLSVGAVSVGDIHNMFGHLKQALAGLR